MNCKHNCGDRVWWSVARAQWVHNSGMALCRFPDDDPRRVITTLTATPVGDVHPDIAVIIPTQEGVIA